MMVDVGSEKGAIDHEEKEFIQNVFEFDDLTAGEIVTHRTDLALLWLDESMDAWKNTIHQSRHTLYPVCADSPDNIVGILNAKDYFRLETQDRDAVMKKAVRPAYFVPEGVKADVLFRNMKRSRNNMAVVLDEYGGLIGIVTVNDLVEQLVGDLGDDADAETDAPEIEKIGEQTWRVSGSAPIEALSEATGVPLPDEDFDTFNGLAFSALGAIPQDGETIELTAYGLAISLLEIREHQVQAAIVRVLDAATGAEASPAAN